MFNLIFFSIWIKLKKNKLLTKTVLGERGISVYMNLLVTVKLVYSPQFHSTRYSRSGVKHGAWKNKTRQNGKCVEGGWRVQQKMIYGDDVGREEGAYNCLLENS